MNHARYGRRTLMALAMAAAATQQARAGLNVDLRVRAVTGGAILNSNKDVLLTAPGQTVTIDLFAIITGTNSLSDEQIQSANGSVVSSGPALGNLSFGRTRDDGEGAADPEFPGQIVPSIRADPFDGLASSDGVFQDLDNDGDIDVGSTGTSPDDYFIARSPSRVSGTNFAGPPAGDIRLIGSVLFSYYYNAGNGDTSINFVTRKSADGGPYFSAAVWFEDGVAQTPTSRAYTVGAPVIVSTGAIPEPALGAAGVLLLPLMRRRQR
jgi:hypothetical protein